MRRSPDAQDSRIFLALVGRLWAGCFATQFLRNPTRASRGFLFVPERTDSGSRSRGSLVGQASNHGTNPLTAHAEQPAAGSDRQFTESPYRLGYETARTRPAAAPNGPYPAAVRPKNAGLERGGPSRGRNAPTGHASPLSRTGSSDKSYSHYRANLRQTDGRLFRLIEENGARSVKVVHLMV